jgi:hypothetical protein
LLIRAWCPMLLGQWCALLPLLMAMMGALCGEQPPAWNSPYGANVHSRNIWENILNKQINFLRRRSSGGFSTSAWGMSHSISTAGSS